MKLNDEQNIAFMNDPRRISAQKEVDSVRHTISVDVKFNGSAQYYLTVLPPLLKRLEQAVENLAIVEATIETELTGKEHFHA